MKVVFLPVILNILSKVHVWSGFNVEVGHFVVSFVIDELPTLSPLVYAETTKFFAYFQAYTDLCYGALVIDQCVLYVLKRCRYERG